MTKEAMKLALELKNSASGYWTEKEISIIEKLIDALAQQAQEPVAWINPDEQNARKAFHWVKAEEFTSPVYTTPPQRKPLTDEEELSNGLAMALHDAVLIRIGANDEATQQATARIDKLVNKYKIEIAHDIKE